MKKAFIIIISFLISVVVDAQTLVGFQGYYTKTKLSTDTSRLNRMQTYESGIGGGLSIKHFELGPIGLLAEINYEKSGFGFKNDTLNIDYKQDLTYISIPALMHVDIGKYTVHFVAAIGPYLNILIDAPEPETKMETVVQSGFSKMYYANFNRFTYGIAAQTGIAICTKIGVFQLTGRADFCLSKLLDFNGIALFNYTLPKTYGVGLNYFVPFGKEKYKKDKPIENDTIVSDLEILSESLNAKSDSVSVAPSTKNKKEKNKKEKKNKAPSEEILQDSTDDSTANQSETEEESTNKPEEQFIEPSENNNDTENGTD